MKTLSRYIPCSKPGCSEPARKEWIEFPDQRIGTGIYRCLAHPPSQDDRRPPGR